mmetsp:Transcript_96396/g.256124  ORF Transcript_96396/g.256124 Transcript_96396/m.256124 type:complete len:311 (+) Transcript_96396:336-1268(+)
MSIDRVMKADHRHAFRLERLLRALVTLAKVDDDLQVGARVALVDLVLEEGGDALEGLVLARQDLCARISNDVAGRVRPQGVVHGHGRPGEGDARQVGKQPLFRVRGPDGYLLALGDSVHLADASAEGPGPLLHLCEASVLPLPRRVEHGGLRVGLAVGQRRVLEGVRLRAAAHRRASIKLVGPKDQVVRRPHLWPRGDVEAGAVPHVPAGVAQDRQGHRALLPQADLHGLPVLVLGLCPLAARGVKLGLLVQVAVLLPARDMPSPASSKQQGGAGNAAESHRRRELLLLGVESRCHAHGGCPYRTNGSRQ